MSDDIIEVVDEIADDVDPARIEREALRLGISEEELMDRVANEVIARLGGTTARSSGRGGA